MSMVDAMGRIDQIQARLLQLTQGQNVRAQAAAPATSASATTFASSLSDAMAPSGATAGSTVANPSAVVGSDVAAAAQKYLGVPYVFGGEDASGMDCSGLVQKVFADLGIEVPRLVSGQMTIGTEVASLAEARPGDLIVTGGGDHILIYAGDNKVIHAPYPGRSVSLVDAYMTDAQITTIRRVIPAEATAVAASSTGASTDIVTSALAALARNGA
ncbi:NlpC/P60 family protein [Cryobacterium sp. TMS1-20-1]|uniref:C40 family peptidase n=1 Tax=Cryobacterium sp. TMS1-20-1 TaxID=1259223 RepID=UPI00106B86A3|nr:C40 family peptidase [Cryobacterium sp. TMS1-20-1]TFC75582.1 NlpC/P60 family protein [Cryobacterium sp. TMS1-20-1]